MTKQFKVEVVTEGLLGSLFLGASRLPIEKMEEVMNNYGRQGWDVTFMLIEKKATVAVLGTRSSDYYLWTIRLKDWPSMPLLSLVRVISLHLFRVSILTLSHKTGPAMPAAQ